MEGNGSGNAGLRRIAFKSGASLLFCTILLSFFCSLSNACTIFCKQQGDTVLAGNNEDWMYSSPSTGWFAASDGNSYGRVCFANYSYIQGGMNEKGLFYDGATCPASEIPYTPGNTDLGMDMGEVILSKCANVREAVEMVKTINIPRNFGDHLLFADGSGASAVVEWVENELRILPGDGKYQLVTNFWLSNPELGWYPCSRFDRAEQLLEESKDATVSLFTGILKATAQNNGNMGTKYSNIYDLRNREVYVFYQGDFAKSARFRLAEELKNLEKGERRTFDLAVLTYSAHEAGTGGEIAANSGTAAGSKDAANDGAMKNDGTAVDPEAATGSEAGAGEYGRATAGGEAAAGRETAPASLPGKAEADAAGLSADDTDVETAGLPANEAVVADASARPSAGEAPENGPNSDSILMIVAPFVILPIVAILYVFFYKK